MKATRTSSKKIPHEQKKSPTSKKNPPLSDPPLPDGGRQLGTRAKKEAKSYTKLAILTPAAVDKELVKLPFVGGVQDTQVQPFYFGRACRGSTQSSCRVFEPQSSDFEPNRSRDRPWLVFVESRCVRPHYISMPGRPHRQRSLVLIVAF